MANIVNGKYGLIEPGDGIAAISLEGGEINLFGNYTMIRMSGNDVFSPINDFIIQKLVEEKSDTMYKVGMGVAIALGIVAGVALVAAAAIPIGMAVGAVTLTTQAAGASVLGFLGGACIFGCASKSASDYTKNTVAHDKATGYDRSWIDFMYNLDASVLNGAVKGACIYGIAVAASALTVASVYGDAVFLLSLLGTGGSGGAASLAVCAEGLAAGGAAVLTEEKLLSIVYQQAFEAVVNLCKSGNPVGEGEAAESKTGVHVEGTAEDSEWPSAKGLLGHDFEEYLHKVIGGENKYIKGTNAGREFDGVFGNRWYEAKSGKFWEKLLQNENMESKFKQKMIEGLRIARENGASYELFSNSPIPERIKQWLIKKGIPFTEILN